LLTSVILHYPVYFDTGSWHAHNIRSEVVNELAEKLAARKRMNKTDAVRIALENELRRLDEAVPLRDGLRPLQERVLSRPATGLDADRRSTTNSVGTC
jgi:antitoxin VapB